LRSIRTANCHCEELLYQLVFTVICVQRRLAAMASGISYPEEARNYFLRIQGHVQHV
jgi:hypothetical protein